MRLTLKRECRGKDCAGDLTELESGLAEDRVSSLLCARGDISNGERYGFLTARRDQPRFNSVRFSTAGCDSGSGMITLGNNPLQFGFDSG